MNLRPKKTKFKKFFKGVVKGYCNKSKISFGTYGLQALERGRISEKQIESARKVINNNLKKSRKLWIKIFPNIGVSKKPTETRMGKGKGDILHFICRVRTGKILFELDYIDEKHAFSALKKSASKLSIKTQVISILDKCT